MQWPATMSRQQRRDRLIFLIPSMTVLALILFYPLLYSVGLSFYSYYLPVPRKTFIGLDNFRYIWNDEAFWDSLGVTARFTGAAVALELVDQLRARLHSLPQVLRDDDQHVAATSDAYRKMRDAAVRGDGEAVGAVVHEFMLAVGARVCERYALAPQRLGDDLKRSVQ